MLTLTPAVTCALAVASLLVAGTDGMRSVTVLVMSVDAGPGPCIEPRDGFLALKTFLKMRFISLIKGQRERSLDYIRGDAKQWLSR
jgi:hypothetical protein